MGKWFHQQDPLVIKRGVAVWRLLPYLTVIATFLVAIGAVPQLTWMRGAAIAIWTILVAASILDLYRSLRAN